jgi:hypothetical protein
MPRNDKELAEIPSGKIKMGRSFFVNMRDRVESIRPEAGDHIAVTASVGYGFRISGDFNVVTLTVCSNGTPADILVFSPKTNTTT